MSCGGDEGQKVSKEQVRAMERQSQEYMKLAHEQFDWAKETRTRNEALLQKILDVQLPIMEQQYQAGKQAKERYEQMYLPKEAAFTEELWGYDTPERREQYATEAVADVRRQALATQQQAQDRLAGLGVDPSQIKAGALTRVLDIGQATSEAQASYGARRQVEEMGRQYKGQVINLGRGVPIQALQSYGQGLQAGQSAMGNQLNTAQVNTSMVGAPTSYFQMGTGALGQAGQMQYGMNSIAGNSNNQWIGALGGIAGAAIGSFIAPGAGTAIGGALGGALGGAAAGQT
jgi:hypothetical protein